MKRIAAVALSLALIAGGSVGAMAQTSGTGTPANQKAPHHKMATGGKMHGHHVQDTAGDRYTDALNTLAAGGYTGISNIEQTGSNFTATAMNSQQQQVSVTVNPATNTVTPNTQ